MFKLEKLLRTAKEYNASDLFITTGSKPALRINGDIALIQEHPVLTKEASAEYILELLSEERRSKLDKGEDLDLSLEIPNVAGFRINVFHQRQGLGAVFRVIPEKIPELEELGLPEHLKRLIDLPHGLVLVTGPTGHGKSTTLAALINEINRKYPKHVITIENPIEYVHKNEKSIIDQREVGTHTPSFGAALKSALRESPDVILVGELRDLETISLALTAAETGHLVFGTLHTSGAAKTISRIIDVFPAEQQSQIRTQLAEILQAVIWQRLVKTADKKSLIPAVEIMFQNHAIANLIRKGSTHQIDNTIETSRQEGMQTMKRSLLELASAGKITKEEAMKFLPIEFEE